MMLKYTFLFVFTIVSTLVNAQTTGWAKRIGPNNRDNIFKGLGFDQENNTIVAGTGNDVEGPAFVLQKNSSLTGEIIFKKLYYNQGGTVEGYKLFSDADSNSYFFGQKIGILKLGTQNIPELGKTPNQYTDYVLIKFDKNGDVVWTNVFGSYKYDDLISNVLYAGMNENSISIITSIWPDSLFINKTFVKKLPLHSTTDHRNYCYLEINTNDGSLKTFNDFGQYKSNAISFVRKNHATESYDLIFSERKALSEFDITQETILSLLSLSSSGTISTTGKKIKIQDISVAVNRFTPSIQFVGENYHLLLTGTKTAKGIVNTKTISSPTTKDPEINTLLSIYTLDDNFVLTGDSCWLGVNTGIKVWRQDSSAKLVIEGTVYDSLHVNGEAHLSSYPDYPTSAFYIFNENLDLEDLFDYSNTNSEIYVREAQFNADNELFVLLNAQKDVLLGPHTAKADGKSWVHMTALTKRGELISTGVLPTHASPKEVAVIHPNPVNEYFSILQKPADVITHIQIMNMQGNLINDFSYDAGTVNIEHLSSGMYLVVIHYLEEGKTKTVFSRIIKK